MVAWETEIRGILPATGWLAEDTLLPRTLRAGVRFSVQAAGFREVRTCSRRRVPKDWLIGAIPNNGIIGTFEKGACGQISSGRDGIDDG